MQSVHITLTEVPIKSYGFNKLTNARNYSKVSVLGVDPYSLRAKLN